MRLRLFLLAFVVLISLTPTNSPTYTIFQPIIVTDEYPTATKKGLAWAYQWSTLAIPEQLNIDGLYLNWGPYKNEPNSLTHIPMLYGNKPHVVDYFLDKIPPDYIGIVLGPNEPDRSDQANMTIPEAAALMRSIETLRPGIVWVSPSYSNAQTNCNMLIGWWNEYLSQGGQPSRIRAWGFHIYPDWRNMSAGAKVNECYGNIKNAGLPNLPMWVTEIGHTQCNSSGAVQYKTWINQLLTDSRVDFIFGYTSWSSAPYCPFLVSIGGNLSLFGLAYRDAGLAYP